MLHSIAARIGQATPADRDRYVDLLRLASILAVAAGHWLLALLTVHGSGTLTHATGMQLTTWLWQVMPLFFFVGGFSHALALLRAPDPGQFWRARAARLLPPAMVMLAVWLVPALLLNIDSGPIDNALDKVTTPLWFLGIYLLLVLLAPVMHRWHRVRGSAVIVVLGLATLLADVLAIDLPHADNVNLAFVWLLVHQLGFLYADGTLTSRHGLYFAGGGLAGMLALTVLPGGYPILMVGLPGAETSNMAPPNLALLAQAFWIIGLALLLRAPLTRWLRRPRVWAITVLGNSVIMTIFCWHLSAAYLTEGVIMLTGLRVPAAGSLSWWGFAAAWELACAVVLALLVMIFRGVERLQPAWAHAPGSALVTGTGIAVSGLGLYVVSQVGLDGARIGRLETVQGIPFTVMSALGVLATGVLLVRCASLLSGKPSARKGTNTASVGPHDRASAASLRPDRPRR
ncbi:acyltransferase [Pseudonocardiaceae bacterium YIM PH 21723]|nr:acyltransferase [Pseudonocardiaceae bacterium YIM PH 21723]